MNHPWLIKLGLLLAFATALFLLATGFNASVQTVFKEPAQEGVLMPPVKARPKPPPPVKEEPDEPLKKRIKFTVTTEDALNKRSFKSLTDGVDVRLISATPIKETRKTTASKPRSVVLLLDNSFSMNQVTPPSMGGGRQLPESDPNYRRLDASKALLQALNPEDRVALACFPRRNPFPGQLNYVLMDPEIITPWGPAQNALADVESLRGTENSGTPLYRGLDLAARLIKPEDPTRSKIIICLTDGRDTEYMDSVPEGMKETIQESGAKLFVVTLGPTPDLVSLNQISDKVIPVLKSEQLSEAFLQIAEDIEEVITGYKVEMMMEVTHPDRLKSRSADITYEAGSTQYRTTVEVPKGDRN